MKPLKDVLDQNIRIVGGDALSQRGFVQTPVSIVRHKDLSMGAKMAYTELLSYAWHNDFCFPGQDRMAKDLGTSRKSVNQYLQELEKKGFIKIRRRGQGKTNLYEVNLKAKVLKM